MIRIFVSGLILSFEVALLQGKKSSKEILKKRQKSRSFIYSFLQLCLNLIFINIGLLGFLFESFISDKD